MNSYSKAKKLNNQYGVCATCDNADLEDVKEHKGVYCTKYHDYNPLSYGGCGSGWSGSYSLAKNRSINEIENALDKIDGNWIVTTICKVLGFNNNCEYLVSFQKLKKYLMSNLNTIYIIAKYDIIGIEISHEILKLNEENRKSLCNRLFINYIIPINNLIKENNMDKSITEYMSMVNELQKIFEIKNYYNFTYTKKLFKEKGM